MKICTIGCGGHASQAHGPVQRQYASCHPGTVLAACCDQDAARASTYRDRFGFKRSYQNVATMLEKENPDAVAVIVPTTVTCKVAAPILEMGIPLFLEKPPGSTSAELEKLIAAAEKGGAPHHVAFNRRHMPILLKAISILDEDMPPESVFRIDYEMARCDRRDPDFSTTAIHAIDAALFIARSPFQNAKMLYRCFENLGAGVAGMEVEAECECGTQVYLNIQPLEGRNTERLCIRAHKKTLVIDFPVMGKRGPGATLSYWHEDQCVVSCNADEMTEDLMGFYGETESFFEAIRNGTPTTLPLAGCRQQVALMEAIRNRESHLSWGSQMPAAMSKYVP